MTTVGSSLPRPVDEAGSSRDRPYAMLHAVTPMPRKSHIHTLLSTTPGTESYAAYSSPESTSSRSYSTIYPVTVGPPSITLTQREAVLMRNFTENMALWVSIALVTITPPEGALIASLGRHH